MHVVATAGHVDHGKSTLVRALTGMEPDRFAEERRRGMTIDLGYAWTDLPSGAQLAFVDVPGHQRFIANMLAGLGPVPAVLFVVAADEGWSRQSDEHLAALDALDVRHGVLAVTRADLADPAVALADARARIGRSSLGEIPAVPVSGTTGLGVEELRAALDGLVGGLPSPDADAPVRLWLDRSFSVRGAGTVVTGTLATGGIAVGDTLLLRGEAVTVRGIQTTGVERGRVDAVARVALNLRGVPQSAVGRGDVLLTPGQWSQTSVLDARVDTGEELAAELVLHVGTAAVPARVRPLGDASGDPAGSASGGGETRLVRITLAEPLPVRAGDRAVLRDPGRQTVAAGVLVLDADPPAFTRRGAAARRAIELATATGALDLETEVRRRGVVRRAVLTRLGVPTAGHPDVRTVGDWLVHAATWQRWIDDAPGVLDARAAADPLDPAPTLGAFRRALGLPDDPALTDTLIPAARLRLADGRVARPDTPRSPLDAAPGLRVLVDRLAGDAFAAPDRDELADLSLGNRELSAAAKAGLLLRVGPDIVLLPDAPERALNVLAALPQPFTTSAARQALGTTRRVVIPLLEHLDSAGLTIRDDAVHRRVTRTGTVG